MTKEEAYKYRQEFNKQNYARIGMCVKPEAKKRWENAMREMGYTSLTQFISECVEEKIANADKGKSTGGTGGEIETEENEEQIAEREINSPAVLILDKTPTSCMNCKFLFKDGADRRRCMASDRKIYSPVGINEDGHYRPKWCEIHSAVAYVDNDGRINDIRDRWKRT